MPTVMSLLENSTKKAGSKSAAKQKAGKQSATKTTAAGRWENPETYALRQLKSHYPGVPECYFKAIRASDGKSAVKYVGDAVKEARSKGNYLASQFWIEFASGWKFEDLHHIIDISL